MTSQHVGLRRIQGLEVVMAQTPRSKGRTGRPYRRAVERVKRRSQVCWLCNEAIDMSLKWPDPMSFSADHVESVKSLPPNDPKLTDPKNLMPAHLSCNSRRGDGSREAPRQLRWSRQWLV
ncbi:HNH endonuclease [Rhodococcus qingshengii]|uniref:HNH endonuclease n=1 Tax=Rhodococcus qingshengii TaxID=334542 RepID=UPI002B001380|nr:HNH endonuclease [Rhodococcus qingshengii]MEA1795126.1 HNH endonuclease [Rhodococcus qingshengii]